MNSQELKSLYQKGTRIIVYPDGQKTELRMNNLGFVLEFPVATPEENRLNKINLLRSRIARDTDELRKLEAQHD